MVERRTCRVNTRSGRRSERERARGRGLERLLTSLRVAGGALSPSLVRLVLPNGAPAPREAYIQRGLLPPGGGR